MLLLLQTSGVRFSPLCIKWGEFLPPPSFLEDLSSRAQDLLVSGEYLVKSLTCDKLDLFLSNLIPKESHKEDYVVPVPPVEKLQPASWTVPVPQDHAPQRIPWLLGEMALMGLNSYFSQLSHMSSLWTPV
ncbi:hypothetical protein DSO57_1032711 [Entomophthora muscae]|uniref:Uncharacterized protein n=1 Tax=Entomophthora muscae TaxID=34485 RepID=A0ACC2UA98_9FUNG|nr:hypothetical protein DSO57_1032711 [Entomophthora muscae]